MMSGAANYLRTWARFWPGDDNRFRPNYWSYNGFTKYAEN